MTGSTYGGIYKWAGYLYDTSLTQYHVHDRVYAPQTGRWDSEDPTLFAAGDSNLYRYVVNDPTAGTDPSGLVPLAVPSGANGVKAWTPLKGTMQHLSYWETFGKGASSIWQLPGEKRSG
jgi:RHS repeat-associated protein